MNKVKVINLLVLMFLVGCSSETEEDSNEETGNDQEALELSQFIEDEPVANADFFKAMEHWYANPEGVTVDIYYIEEENRLDIETTDWDNNIIEETETYENLVIETEGEWYYLTNDEDLDISFEAVGERTIRDEEGMLFQTVGNIEELVQ